MNINSFPILSTTEVCHAVPVTEKKKNDYSKNNSQL